MLSDTLVGGLGADTLIGLDEDDDISGLFGDDWITGGRGNDHIDGGDGNDSLFGQSGDDYLYGGAGVDRLIAGMGEDTLVSSSGVAGAGPGDDLILLKGGAAGTSGVLVFAGEGNDIADASNSSVDNRVFLGAGSDVFYDGLGDDTITAAGQDTVDFNWLSAGGNNLVRNLDFEAGGVINIFNIENIHDAASLNEAFDYYLSAGGPYDAYLVQGGGDVVFVYDDLRIRVDNLGGLIE